MRIGYTTTRHPHAGVDPAAVNANMGQQIRNAGGDATELTIRTPCDAVAAVAALDGLVFSGGEDVNPALYGAAPDPMLGTLDHGRDAWEMALLRAALSQNVPILGICRGAQLINVGTGGTLVQHLPDITSLGHVGARDGYAHTVTVNASQLADIIAPGRDCAGSPLIVNVNSLHHQAVRTTGAGIRVTAHAPDGTIEAFEATDGRAILAVQWHPELLPEDSNQQRIMRWVVTTARRQRTFRTRAA